MGNGNYTYTIEQEVAHYAQFRKAMKIAGDRQRPPEFITRSLQAIISDDVNVFTTPKVITTPTGNVYHVVGNYDSASTAIEAGNYDEKWGLARDPDKIPLIVQPVNSFVRPVLLGEFVRNDKLFELYPRIADPMTLFTLGAQHPELQREGPIFTVWKFGDQFWCAVLGVGGRGRSVFVDHDDPDRGWYGHYRVLVREFVSPEG